MNAILQARNLNNLTGLWKKLGAQPPAFSSNSTDIFQSPSWPNRCWLDAFASSDRVSHFTGQIKHFPVRIMVPVWGINTPQDEKLEAELREQGFAPTLLQTGMYLDLNESSNISENGLTIYKVTTPAQVTEWTRVASAAFGYAIDETVIAQLPGQADIELLLVNEKNQPQAIATALLFATGDTIGVHMVGVAPHGRGKGIAMQLMQTIIKQAKQQGYTYMTLQASPAGEGIYRKLGFQQQFVMRSFKRTPG